MDSLPNIWKKYRKWCCLVILIHEGGESACKNILNNMGIKDLSNGTEIYQKLEPHAREITKMLPYQRKILLPRNKVIDTSKLDISLQTHIIRILDTTKKYPLIGKLRDKRNDFFHMPEGRRHMTERQFKKYWIQISRLLTDLCYDMKLMNGLKTNVNLSKEREELFEYILHQVKVESEKLHEHMDVQSKKIKKTLNVEAKKIHEQIDWFLIVLLPITMAAVAALMQGNTTSNSVKNTKSGNESATLKIHKTTQRGFSVVGGKIKDGALEKCEQKANKDFREFVRNFEIDLQYQSLLGDIKWLRCVFFQFKDEYCDSEPRVTLQIEKLMIKENKNIKVLQALSRYTEVFNEFIPSLKNMQRLLKHFHSDLRLHVERTLRRVTEDWESIQNNMQLLIQAYENCYFGDDTTLMASDIVIPYNSKTILHLKKFIPKNEIAASVFTQMFIFITVVRDDLINRVDCL